MARNSKRLILAIGVLCMLGLAACGTSSTPGTFQAKTATPFPPLLATHTPDKFGTVLEFSGTTNEHTGFFHVPDGAKILWSGIATGDNATLAIGASNRDGSSLGLIGGGNLASDGTPLGGTYVVHGARDISLQIAVVNGGYSIGVEIP